MFLGAVGGHESYPIACVVSVCVRALSRIIFVALTVSRTKYSAVCILEAQSFWSARKNVLLPCIVVGAAGYD